jgi:hypothetical protein
MVIDKMLHYFTKMQSHAKKYNKMQHKCNILIMHFINELQNIKLLVCSFLMNFKHTVSITLGVHLFTLMNTNESKCNILFVSLVYFLDF